MSDFITHVAAIAVGVLVTLLLVGGYNNATAFPTVSRKKKATVTTIVRAKATTTDNIDELKYENTRLQVLVNTQKTELAIKDGELAIKDGELATKEDECQCLRDENKLLKGRASSSSSVAAAFAKKRSAATTAATVEKAPAPATTVEDIFVSSSAVADVMVEEGKNNDILSKILDFVATTTPSRRRNDTNNDYDDDGNETIMPAGKTTTTTTLDELINLTLVSKRFYKLILTHEEDWTKKRKLMQLFVLSAKENNEDNGRTLNFIHTMNQYREDENTYRKLQRYEIFKLENTEQFDDIPNDDRFREENMMQMEMTGIRFLELSSLPSTTIPMNHSLTSALARMMPNLHELYLSHTNFTCDALFEYVYHCRRLEKITWYHINKGVWFYLDGRNFFYLNEAKNLKEINMDDSTFISYGHEEAEMSDLNNQPTIFLFHKCEGHVLERVSIRNAKYHKLDNTIGSVSQDMLIKFIRNAPATLKWFRCDLSQENMEMLTKERPGIQLLN